MARGWIARRRARGGEGIQALRAKRALSAVGAFVVLGGVCAYPPLRADRIALPLTVVGGCALLALAVGLVGRWGPLVQLALMLSLGSYAAYLGDETAFDRAAPFVAAALVLAGELAYTSLEPPARRTWPFTSAMVAAAALLAALLLGAAGAGGGGLRDLVLGVVAAAGALALVARLAVTRRES